MATAKTPKIKKNSVVKHRRRNGEQIDARVTVAPWSTPKGDWVEIQPLVVGKPAGKTITCRPSQVELV